MQQLVPIQQDRTIDKKKDFVALYRIKGCNISETCAAVDIDRATYYRWCESDPAFDEVIKEIEASLVDWAESMLCRNILEGKEKSLFVFLYNRAGGRWKEKGNNVTVTQTTVNVNKVNPSQMDEKELDSVVRNIVAHR